MELRFLPHKEEVGRQHHYNTILFFQVMQYVKLQYLVVNLQPRRRERCNRRHVNIASLTASKKSTRHTLAFLLFNQSCIVRKTKSHPDNEHRKWQHAIPLRRCKQPIYRRRPRLPPLRRVLSVGTGVTSSMRPIFMPARARARRAA